MKRVFLALALAALLPAELPASDGERHGGLPTSVHGIWVGKGELLVIPTVWTARNKDFEYDPNEFGFSAPGESLGGYETSEAAILAVYGWTDRLAVELRVASIEAKLDRAEDDTSAMPPETKESGLGNVQARGTWRFAKESGRRPELYGYATVLFPHDEKNVLTGTPDWVIEAGFGAIRGYRWGTLGVRASSLFELASASVTDWGEVAVEYWKPASERVRLGAALVMVQGDEGSAVGNLEWRFGPRVSLRVEGREGLTSHALDWSAQAGAVIRFP